MEVTKKIKTPMIIKTTIYLKSIVIKMKSNKYFIEVSINFFGILFYFSIKDAFKSSRFLS